VTTMTVEQALVELEQRHRALYATPEIDERLASIVRAGPHTNLTEAAILHILRSARSVFVDTHVEVVSGHHTATYLRFESIARYPDLIGLIADDMATWIKQTFQHGAVTGLLATASAARCSAWKIPTASRRRWMKGSCICSSKAPWKTPPLCWARTR